MDISVIVAIYNVEKYLSDCIESLINQDFSTAEFILVNDGSSDKSSQICDKAQLSDSRIKVINKNNGGLSDARNAGLEVATGKFIMFIDGDDVLDRGTLSILFRIAQQTDSDLVQYGYRETSSADLHAHATFNGKYEYVTDRHDMYMRLYQLGGIAASGCTKLIKRRALKNLKFAFGKLHEDEFFTTELLASVRSVTYITDFTPYQYIIRAGSIITCGFNPKRVYDLSAMYEKRIKKLNDLGFSDLADAFQTRYFSNLYIQYHKSCFADNKECTRFICKKLIGLGSAHSDGLNYEMRVAKVWPRLMLPFLYKLRSVLHKKL